MQTGYPSRRQWGWQLLLAAALLLAFWLGLPATKPAPSLVPPASDTLPLKGHWQFNFASDADTTLVHAASMVTLPDGRLRGFWFAGSREGAADVSINSSVFDPSTGKWTDEEPVLTREQLMQQWGRYVRKLGNMVPVLDADGSLRLFVVAVSFGGWAASRIVVLRSTDEGAHWHFETELKTSPFLNISTLVKAPPVHYDDGSIGLPVYHEMATKFGELLRLDSNNRILAMSRIGHGRKAIQPLLLVAGSERVAAFLRPETEPHDGVIDQSMSLDAGRDWTHLKATGLATPSSALGGVALTATHWLLVGNCNRFERDDLCVRETLDGGKSWHKRWTLHDRDKWRDHPLDFSDFSKLLDESMATDTSIDEPKVLQHARHNKCEGGNECEFQFDYPYMLRSANGDLHILYTWNKTMIRHAWFRLDKNVEVASGS